MNAVAAMKMALAAVQDQGANVTLADLEPRLASESLTDADRQECREWLDGMLAQEGPAYRALDALVAKLSTIGSAIAQRLDQPGVERPSGEQISRPLKAYLDFKRVSEEVLTKQ